MLFDKFRLLAVTLYLGVPYRHGTATSPTPLHFSSDHGEAGDTEMHSRDDTPSITALSRGWLNTATRKIEHYAFLFRTKCDCVAIKPW